MGRKLKKKKKKKKSEQRVENRKCCTSKQTVAPLVVVTKQVSELSAARRLVNRHQNHSQEETPALNAVNPNPK